MECKLYRYAFCFLEEGLIFSKAQLCKKTGPDPAWATNSFYSAFKFTRMGKAVQTLSR